MSNPYEQIVHPAGKKPEDPIGKMDDDFVEFVNQRNYTADQVREAYYQLMGASPRTDTDQALVTLRTEMERLEQEHFPINRFAEFIGTLQKVEDAVPAYIQYVESLPISKNEKWMLASLVKKQRSGELEILISGKHLARIIILGEKDDSELMANELLHALKQVVARAKTGQSIEFIFTE